MEEEEELTGNDDPKPESKEEPKMADQNTDWRKAAENAGYSLVPAADLQSLKSAQEELKNLRSLFPDEARGKEAGYVNTLRETAGKVSAYEEQLQSVDSLKQENEELKTQNQSLARGKKLSDMWGHVGRIQQIRNVRVHDRFIDENKLVDFDLGKFDLSKPKGQADFADSVWKNVLEPAYKEQTEIVDQVAPTRSRRERPDVDDDTDRDSGERDPAFRAFGGLA